RLGCWLSGYQARNIPDSLLAADPALAWGAPRLHGLAGSDTSGHGGIGRGGGGRDRPTLPARWRPASARGIGLGSPRRCRCGRGYAQRRGRLLWPRPGKGCISTGLLPFEPGGFLPLLSGIARRLCGAEDLALDGLLFEPCDELSDLVVNVNRLVFVE